MGFNFFFLIFATDLKDYGPEHLYSKVCQRRKIYGIMLKFRSEKVLENGSIIRQRTALQYSVVKRVLMTRIDPKHHRRQKTSSK